MEALINTMMKLGFTESEAKVYITLLKHGAQNGYETSKSSGIARSKVYGILEKLTREGVLASSHNGKSQMYRAEPVSKIEKMITSSIDTSLTVLKEETDKLVLEPVDEEIWQLFDYEQILIQLEMMIEKAQKEILIQIWSEDLSLKIHDMISTKEQTVPTVIVLYDEKGLYEHSLKSVYTHGFEQELADENGVRWMTCVIDSQEILYASIPNKKQTTAIHTRNSSMVWFAKEYIKHDAYCLKLLNDFPEATREKYGQNLVGLRRIFKPHLEEN